MDRMDAAEAAAVTAGLCAACRHARQIRTQRGSTFWLCERAVREPQYLRYPRLPVVDCAGHELGHGVATRGRSA